MGAPLFLMAPFVKSPFFGGVWLLVVGAGLVGRRKYGVVMVSIQRCSLGRRTAYKPYNAVVWSITARIYYPNKQWGSSNSPRIWTQTLIGSRSSGGLLMQQH
jgi:hypothetical protein